MEIRDVHPGDLNLICRHRKLMFREAGRDEGIGWISTTAMAKSLVSARRRKTGIRNQPVTVKKMEA